MSNLVRFDALRSVAIASITTSYTALGLPLAHAMRVLHFINDSNGVYLISFDGVNDNTIILANGFALYDLTSDQDMNESFRYQNGTQIYIKYVVAPTTETMSSNTFYLASVYGKGE